MLNDTDNYNEKADAIIRSMIEVRYKTVWEKYNEIFCDSFM